MLRFSFCILRLFLVFPMYLAAFLAAVLSAGSVDAIIIDGELGALNWRRFEDNFIGKFCFDYSVDKEIGLAQLQTWKINSAPRDAKVYFLMYDDEKLHWRKVAKRWESASCADKIEAASLSMELNMSVEQDDHDITISEKIRPRFWYFAFASCGTQLLAPPIRFKLHLTNSMESWQKEFSYDHKGLFQVYVIFMILTAVLALIAMRCSGRGTQSSQETPSRSHPYIQLLLLAIFSTLIGCFLHLGHYILFINNGYGSMRIRFAAVLSGIIANNTMYLICMLASIGWAIKSTKLNYKRLFLGILCVAGGLTAFCELKAETVIDRSTKLYSYQSVPGMSSLIMKIFMFCWFGFQIRNSYKEEHSDRLRRFYMWLGLCMSVWFLNVPITTLLAFVVSPWWRYMVVVTAELSFRMAGLLFLTQMFLGSLSPISALNTFSAESEVGLWGGSY